LIVAQHHPKLTPCCRDGQSERATETAIVIGGFERKLLQLLGENAPESPLTHDLMKNFMSAFNIYLQEIIICDLQEGIFLFEIGLASSEHDTVEIDSRTSDALALAVRFGCPIYTYEHILESAGILMEDSSSKKKSGYHHHHHRNNSKGRPEALSLEELNTLLNEVLEHEDYIRAIRHPR